MVFELHKNGSLTYWLKSENNLVDSIKQEITRTIRQSVELDNLKKKYERGFWKVNYKDSILIIEFCKEKIFRILNLNIQSWVVLMLF